MLRSHKPLAWTEISLSNLRHNLNQIKKRVGKKVKIMAIVKADAYGHGMKVVSRELYKNGIRFFGVANLDEALELRRLLGRRVAILVLGSFHKDQTGLFIQNGIRPTLSSWEDARIFRQAARKQKKAAVPVHIKADTGMGRLGIWHEEAETLLAAISKWPELLIEGVYTHFAGADAPNSKSAHRQIRLFGRLVQRLNHRKIRPQYVHAANSMGVARFKKAHLNLVRPGIVLYGIHPGKNKAGLNLRPVLSLKARITLLKPTPQGRAVSYNSTHITRRDTVLAVLPIGYSHGYRVGFSNRSQVLIRGKRCPVVGRVTMDQTLVDAGSVPGVRRWDTATLIGSDKKSRVSAEELARLAQTIPYEVVCGLSSRILRTTVS